MKDKLFLAEEAGTGARVALRVLDESARDGAIFESLREHASRVTALAGRCPAIAAIHECGREDGGSIYLALEHPTGTTLAETLQREAPMHPDRAVRLAIRIAEALESAHMTGLVHGSLTPRMVVLVGSDEAVKLTQFGIDWLRATRRSGRAGAGAGVEGSPYTAPEQARSGEATPQSDVYAVGAILYEALLGRPPAAALSGRRRGGVTSMRKVRPEVTRSLDNIVLRALESDPARRYRDMTDFFNDLWGEVNPFSGSTPAPTGAVRRIASTAGWARSIAVGLVLGVGGSIALLSWLLIGGSPAPVTVPRAAAPRPESTVIAPPPSLPPSEPASVALPPAPPPATEPPSRPERAAVATPSAPERPVVEAPPRPAAETPARPVVQAPPRPAVEAPRTVARPAPVPRSPAAVRVDPAPPARPEESPATAPARDDGDDTGAIIDWLLKESSSARR